LKNAAKRTQNSFEPTNDEMKRLDDAIRNPEFRRLLCDFAREQNDPAVRDLYEAETIEYERSVGLKTTFLHPTPGFVIKTTNLRTDEKTFININSDPSIDPTLPKGEDARDGGGKMYAIPYSLTKQRTKDTDKGGRSCSVYDCTFNPGVVDMAVKGNRAVREMLAQTAVDGVEALAPTNIKSRPGSGDPDVVGVKLDRENIKFPKMKFKGKSEPSVIRERLEREPKYKMTYRHKSSASVADYASECQGRPVEIQVEVSLPELENAKAVELDVTNENLELVSKEPVAYRLLLAFPYPVEGDSGCAKFNKQDRKLTVTVPVKQGEVRRLVSTDSGYGGETDQSFSDDGVEENDTKSEEGAVEVFKSAPAAPSEDPDDPEDLMFPPYSCKIYEDLMVITLDVKNVAEKSLDTTSMAVFDEPYGFCLKFTSIGRGFVPFRYGFYCAFVLPEGNSRGAQAEPRPEIEVWDNNMIVKVKLPKGVDCREYRVGSSARDLTLYTLPQMHRRALWKRQKDDSLEPENNFNYDKDDDYDRATKERHSSGESEDSALSSSPNSEAPIADAAGSVAQANEDDETGGAVPLLVVSEEPAAKVKSILKPAAGAFRSQRRCFSESLVDTMVGTSQSSTSSCLSSDTIPEESEEPGSSEGSKKSVRFNEVVQRQVFRPHASILGQRHKNAKKNEQKRRKAQQRRASESDAVDEIRNAEDKRIATDDRESSPEGDSDAASSISDSSAPTATTVVKTAGKGKKRRQNKNKKQQLSEPTSDLMFKLDI